LTLFVAENMDFLSLLSTSWKFNERNEIVKNGNIALFGEKNFEACDDTTE
jgi:hypothetical protein